MGQLAVTSIVGGMMSVAFNGLSNYATGRPFFENAHYAYAFGAIAGPLSYLFPAIGAGLATWGVIGSLGQAYEVVGDSNSSVGQKAAALGLVGLAFFGEYAALRNVKVKGFWKNSSVFGSGATAGAPETSQVGLLPLFENAQPQPTLRSIPRLPQDVAVNPVPPPASTTGTIGNDPVQNAALARWLVVLVRLGARDIRVNQQQVNAAGERVGINRPDLQFTYEGERWYIEWDRPSSRRGIPHGERILANDPHGRILIFTLGE